MPRSTSMASSTSLAAGAARSLSTSEEFRRVTAQRGVALADAVQEIEILGLGEFLRLGDALRRKRPRA